MCHPCNDQEAMGWTWQSTMAKFMDILVVASNKAEAQDGKGYKQRKEELQRELLTARSTQIQKVCEKVGMHIDPVDAGVDIFPAQRQQVIASLLESFDGLNAAAVDSLRITNNPVAATIDRMRATFVAPWEGKRKAEEESKKNRGTCPTAAGANTDQTEKDTVVNISDWHSAVMKKENEESH